MSITPQASYPISNVDTAQEQLVDLSAFKGFKSVAVEMGARGGDMLVFFSFGTYVAADNTLVDGALPAGTYYVEGGSVKDTVLPLEFDDNGAQLPLYFSVMAFDTGTPTPVTSGAIQFGYPN